MSDAESPVVDADDESPLEQAAAGVTTGLVLLVAFGLLALDVSWFWIAFPVGFGGLLPAAVGLARYYQQSEAMFLELEWNVNAFFTGGSLGLDKCFFFQLNFLELFAWNCLAPREFLGVKAVADI